MSIRSRKEIPKIMNRDGTACYLCGLELVDLRLPPWNNPKEKTPKPKYWPDNWPTLDHVVPESQGGTDGMYNLRAACHTCNNAKADLSVEEFFEMVDRRDKGRHRRLPERDESTGQWLPKGQ